MKNKLSILAALSLVTVVCFAAVGCSAPEVSNEGEAEASVAFAVPTFQPVDHEGRFESGGADSCYGCHGGGSTAGGPAIPDSHYVDGNADSGEIDDVRKQCITCHPVSE